MGPGAAGPEPNGGRPADAVPRDGGLEATETRNAPPADAPPEACPFVIGPDGLARLAGAEADAWTGLLRAHRRLTRTLEAALEERHGLSLSALGALGRLAAAEDRRLRIARLADRSGLSLSRTSRLLDALERRGLVERQPCPEDSRASNVQLTAAGLALAQRAQADHLADIRRAFIDRLTPEQVGVLAAAFARLAPPPP